MTKEDAIAIKAVRKSTLKSLKLKKKLRISQIKKDAEAKIREINIQYADDPERLKAKYAASDYARSEKAKKRAEAKIAKEKKHQELLRKLRPYTIAEEIFSSIVQGIGAGLFIAATVLLVVASVTKVPQESKAVYTSLFASFGGVMILNYIMSVLHHALLNASAKEVFKRLCRICIFLVIASALMVYSYTAYIHNAVSAVYALVILGISAVICLVGIFMYAIGGSRMEIVNTVFNAVLGWAGFFICARLYHAITPKSFGMLVTSGVLFTTGLVFCSIRKVKFLHAIGDLIILSASVFMFYSFFFLY